MGTGCFRVASFAVLGCRRPRWGLLNGDWFVSSDFFGGMWARVREGELHVIVCRAADFRFLYIS